MLAQDGRRDTIRCGTNSQRWLVEQDVVYADKAIPIFEDGLDDLHALEPPETIEESVDAWLATGDAALERVRKVRDAAKDGDEAEVGRLTREAAAAERGSDALARQVGATTCAED